jgi:hypothetical protein
MESTAQVALTISAGDAVKIDTCWCVPIVYFERSDGIILVVRLFSGRR